MFVLFIPVYAFIACSVLEDSEFTTPELILEHYFLTVEVKLRVS